MKRTSALLIAMAAIASSLVFGFQNCSSGSLPSLQDSQSVASVPAAYLDLIYNSSLISPNTEKITASNALGALSFVVTSGSTGCSVDSTGTVSSVVGMTTTVICNVTVTDAGGNLPSVAYITVSPAASTVPTISSGSQVFDVTPSVPFTLPAFNTLTIEVYGAGGGGGGLTYYMGGFATAGASGGLTSISGGGISMVATGGAGGSPGAVAHSSPVAGAGGAAGSATGGATGQNLPGTAGQALIGGAAGGQNGGAGGTTVTVSYDIQGQPGGAPGGGGGGRGYSWEDGYGAAGGGGGGGYAKASFSSTASSSMPTLAAATPMTIVVGAGGIGGAHSSNPTAPQGGAGGAGRVVITWQ